MDVLGSKLQAPRISKILPRDRLTTLFNDICLQKLALVTAGAGYGKTTLVAHALEETGHDRLWYSLDTFDREFRLFMTYLVNGLRQTWPEFGAAIMGGLAGSASPNEQEEWLFRFTRELETTVTRETVMVLDDYHLVQASVEINQALEFILERLPRNLHLVIISRTKPPLRTSRLRAGQQLLEIGERDLAFTAAEVRRLYQEVHKIAVNGETLVEIHQKTGGWAASLILFSYALKENPAFNTTPMDFKGSQRDIFNYLEENIFEIQPPEVKTFMVKTALLPMMDVRLCNRILNIGNAGELLPGLVENHLLTFPLDGTNQSFRYHHLLRDFLVEKLHKTCSPEEIEKLHISIARAYEKENRVEALDHYIDGKAFDRAAKLLTDHEIGFMMEGKTLYLRKSLSKVPEEVIRTHPQLLFMTARIHSVCGNPREAIVRLKAARKVFQKERSRKNALKCLVDLASQYYFTGHVREAKLLMEQVLDEIDATAPTFTITMTFLIFLSAVLGEIGKADAYTEQAQSVIADYPEYERGVATALITLSTAYRYYITGDFHRAQALNLKLLEQVRDLKIDSCLPLTYYQCAATGFFLGEHEQGYEYAAKGVEASERIELRDSQKGWLYLAWGQNALGLGRTGEAMAHVRKSLGIFEIPGNRWGIANAHELRHQIRLARDDPARAKNDLSAALDIIDGYGLTLTQGMLEISMANLLIKEKAFDKALDLLNRSRENVRQASFYLFRNFMLTARCHGENGDTGNARKWLKKALALADDKAYHSFVPKEAPWTASPMDGMNPGRARQTGNSANAAPCLTIHLFGTFRVLKGDREIPPGAWKSSKALTIFKYLAANREMGFIQRDVLIELLWPDEDIKKTGKRFNVAMSALRKILEPDIAPKAASAYIERRNNAYRLDPDAAGNIDVERFLIEFTAGKRSAGRDLDAAMQHFFAGEAVYKGPFLEENPYDDWCIREREHLHKEYLSLLCFIMDFHGAKKDYAKSIQYGEKFLKADPFDERTHRKLMEFYAALGNNPGVIRAFDRCRATARAMDCPLSKETVSLFNRLIPRKN
ncbi:MAG: transcriptional regulator [Desulfobacteraceae bacterium]|nr:transcriptional regulator [Desulfobacteraceae bacterium]